MPSYASTILKGFELMSAMGAQDWANTHQGYYSLTCYVHSHVAVNLELVMQLNHLRQDIQNSDWLIIV